jgi:hypothetical protein
MGKAPFSNGPFRLTNKRDTLVYSLAVWYVRVCTHSIGSDTHDCSHAREVGTETPCPAQSPGVGTDTSLPGSQAAAVPLCLSLNVYGALHALAVLWKGSKISRSPKAQVAVCFICDRIFDNSGHHGILYLTLSGRPSGCICTL